MKHKRYYSWVLKSIFVITAVFIVFTLITRVIYPLIYSGDIIDAHNTQDAQSIVFRLAESMPSEYPSAKAAQYFADIVEEQSNGHIKIKVYYESDLGSDPSVLDQVQFGGIAMARVSGSAFINHVEALALYFNLNVYVNKDKLMQTLEQEKATISDMCQKERYVILSWLYPDDRCFYSDEDAVVSINDLEDKKIMIQDSFILKDAIKKLHGIPVNDNAADIYKSMSSGYMDIGESTWGEVINSEHFKFIQYLTITDYLAIPDLLVISAQEYSVLGNADRELLYRCAQETSIYYGQLLEEDHKQWLTMMEELNKNVTMDENLNKQLKSLIWDGEVDDYE